MRWSAALGIALNLALVGVTIRVLDRVLAEYHLDDVVRAVSAVPTPALAFGFACSALGYLALVGYDYIAFRFAGRPLSWRTMLVPSFVTFAVSNSAPASLFTAGSVRYRLYAGLGLTAAEAAVIVSVNIATYALGLCALAGALLLAHPLVAWDGHAWLGLPVRILGVLLLLLVAGYLVIAARWRSPIVLLGHRLRAPSFRVALRQLGVSTADWLLSSAALYALVASVARIGYFDFLTTFFAAQAAALVLPTPGGIGVFEAALLLLRPTGASAPHLLAALLMYRVMYYLLPLLVAGGLLAVRLVRGAGAARWRT